MSKVSYLGKDHNYHVYGPGVVFTKGLSQVLGLSWLYFYTKVKPKTWLRPFVNTAQVHIIICFILLYKILH